MFRCLSRLSYLRVLLLAPRRMWPLGGKKKKERSSSQSWSAYCKRKKSSIARCSFHSPSVWMGPYLGLHTRGGEVCGCLWWETSVCDMGVLSGMGEEKVGVFAPASVRCSTMLIISAGGDSCCLCRYLHSPWTVCRYILAARRLSTLMGFVYIEYVSVKLRSESL